MSVFKCDSAGDRGFNLEEVWTLKFNTARLLVLNFYPKKLGRQFRLLLGLEIQQPAMACMDQIFRWDACQCQLRVPKETTNACTGEILTSDCYTSLYCYNTEKGKKKLTLIPKVYKLKAHIGVVTSQ